MADLSDDPAVLNLMIAEADRGADVVSGSRYMRGGKQVGGPVLKSLMSRLAGRCGRFAEIRPGTARPRCNICWEPAVVAQLIQDAAIADD